MKRIYVGLITLVVVLCVTISLARLAEASSNASETVISTGSNSELMLAQRSPEVTNSSKDLCTKSVKVPPPKASFVAAPTIGYVPLIVKFIDTSSGDITSYLWEFGNGASSKLAQPPAQTYTKAGTYTITLTVTGPGGSSTASQSIRAQTLPPPPKASFKASPTIGYVPLIVRFTDTSSGVITSYLWEFGNGASSVLAQPPSQRYTKAGTYTITLKVTGPGGTSTATQSITAEKPK